MPIGSDARYVHAKIQKATKRGMTVDEDVIITTPGEPVIAIWENFARWNRTKSRCEPEGDFLFGAPVPHDFVVSPSTWDGLTPNSGLAVVLPDGRTLIQTQPFARCTPGGPGTSATSGSSTSIYSDGYYGAHGGSRLSAIGGALRHWELMPGSGPIRHALKINLFCERNVYYDDETEGYRWPALTADGAASRTYGTLRTVPPVKELRMGALLALPPWMDLDSLGFETEPARILAETFRNYGAYLVDNTAWDVYAIITEWSPEGRFKDEFQKNWGFSFKPSSKDTPWSRDMDRIFLNLHVVDNNSPDSIGGGGEPGMPLAPPFLPTVGIGLETEGIDKVPFTRPQNFKASINTKTKLMISPAPEGYTFLGWEVTEGDAIVESPLSLETMISVGEQNAIIRAKFNINSYQLLTSVTGEGNISVNPKLDEYAYGTEIQMKAIPDSGWIFKEWEGHLDGAENPVSIIVEDITEINAVFEPEVIDRIDNENPEEELILAQDRRNNLVSLIFTNQNPGTQIEVYDILGKQVFSSEKSYESRITIKTDDFTEGIYFIRIRKDNKVLEVKRFIR